MLVVGKAPSTGSNERLQEKPSDRQHISSISQRRNDDPVLQRSAQGSVALEAAESPQALHDALSDLQKDFFAASGREPRLALRKTWIRFHTSWFGEHHPPVPVTPLSLTVVAALFKHGGYRSWPNYLSIAKQETIACGGTWDPQLEQ